MAPSCNHEEIKCVHFPAWSRIRHSLSEREWTPYSLSVECDSYEKSLEEGRKMTWEWEHQMEWLSENETEVDPDEAEDVMNNVPSPRHREYCCWNPEYEARRQARKRLWSPPLTPETGDPKYSLQPSQRPPSPRIRRRHRHPPSSPPSLPQASDQFQLHLPPKAQYKVRKSTKTAHPRRPITRSMRTLKAVSLHNRKDQVVIEFGDSGPRTASFAQYLESILA